MLLNLEKEKRGLSPAPLSHATLNYLLESPYPGFGTRSTTCVFGWLRAFSTVVNSPVFASRPRKLVLDSLLIVQNCQLNRAFRERKEVVRLRLVRNSLNVLSTARSNSRHEIRYVSMSVFHVRATATLEPVIHIDTGEISRRTATDPTKLTDRSMPVLVVAAVLADTNYAYCHSVCTWAFVNVALCLSIMPSRGESLHNPTLVNRRLFLLLPLCSTRQSCPLRQEVRNCGKRGDSEYGSGTMALMHLIQEKLLAQIDQDPKVGQMTLREIGKKIGESSPQKVKHHLLQLEKSGFIAVDRKNKVINRITGGKLKESSSLIAVPILGYANCGQASVVAEERPEGYLKVSSRLLPKTKKIFALRAVGNSLNRAKIGKEQKSLDNGDYAIIDYENKSPKDGDYVLSVIGGLANLKKYKIDLENKQIILSSESTQAHSPIFIHQDDDYLIGGKIVAVLKTGA